MGLRHHPAGQETRAPGEKADAQIGQESCQVSGASCGAESENNEERATEGDGKARVENVQGAREPIERAPSDQNWNNLSKKIKQRWIVTQKHSQLSMSPDR